MSRQGRTAYTVSQLTALVQDALLRSPELEDVLVEGELSNLRNPGSGHLYFTLKDAGAALRCVCFRREAARIPFHPENGMTVIARGRVDVYGADGTYQLYVQSLEPAGVGAMALAAAQLARRLAAEGVFDDRVKRPLPLLPRRVAVVTSSTGAAVRDVCTVLRRRAASVGAVVVPTPVQGEGAEEAIIRALGRAQDLAGVDVILLVRGGGSLEDLVAFQGEALARAIRASRRPVVTGIGHQTDTTIADFAADRRAPTPSAAAELAVPELAALREELGGRALRLGGALRAEVSHKRAALGGATQRLGAASPARRLPALRQSLDSRVGALRSALRSEVAIKRRRLDHQSARLLLASPQRRLPAHREGLERRAAALRTTTRGLLTARRASLATAAARLEALSPRRVIDRGYTLTLDARSGALVRSPAQAPAGTLLRTVLAAGELHSRVVEPSMVERMYDRPLPQPQATHDQDE